MPTADYKDNITEEIFEVYFRNNNIPDTITNEKTGNLSTRIYSGNVGFEFKGSGFYETDYKRKNSDG
jgi:predicted nucleic acid-binding Zn ribbon protein